MGAIQSPVRKPRKTLGLVHFGAMIFSRIREIRECLLLDSLGECTSARILEAILVDAY
jgi:hypothetical protein